MKRLISFLLLALLMVSSAMATTLPHVVYGKITDNGFPVEGLELHIIAGPYNDDTIAKTLKDGYYQVDVANVYPDYRSKDSVTVAIKYCEDLDRCKRTVVLGTGSNLISFDISKESLPAVPEGTKYVCPDGQVVLSSTECPLVVEITPPVKEIVVEKETFVCPDGETKVSDVSFCPELEESESWLAWIIAALAALLAGAGGWRFVNGKFFHNHKGITGYHDPNVLHTSAKYRHTRWKDGRLKCIKDVKKIQAGIDLSKE